MLVKFRFACLAISMSLLLLSGGIRAQQTTSPQTSGTEFNDPTKSGGGKGSVEILSDTKGFDFGPYVSKALEKIRNNWRNLVPAEARPPQLRSGVTSIDFSILEDGKVGGMKIVDSSGSRDMDWAAWGGITASQPFAPLPRSFKGDHLTLRVHFLYNPAKPVGGPSNTAPSSQPDNNPTSH